MNGKEIVRRARGLHDYAYWYGGKGEIASVELADRLKKENPGVWTNAYYKSAMSDVAAKRRVGDCSFLVCYAYQIGMISSYKIKESFKEFNSPKDGMVLWRPGHVAIYDDGRVIELASQAVDFRIKKYNKSEWSAILGRPGVNYDYEYEKGWHYDEDCRLWYAYGNKKGEYYKECEVYLRNEGGTVSLFRFDKNGYVETGKAVEIRPRCLRIYSESGCYEVEISNDLKNVVFMRFPEAFNGKENKVT